MTAAEAARAMRAILAWSSAAIRAPESVFGHRKGRTPVHNAQGRSSPRSQRCVRGVWRTARRGAGAEDTRTYLSRRYYASPRPGPTSAAELPDLGAPPCQLRQALQLPGGGPHPAAFRLTRPDPAARTTRWSCALARYLGIPRTCRPRIPKARDRPHGTSTPADVDCRPAAGLDRAALSHACCARCGQERDTRQADVRIAIADERLRRRGAQALEQSPSAACTAPTAPTLSTGLFGAPRSS